MEATAARHFRGPNSSASARSRGGNRLRIFLNGEDWGSEALRAVAAKFSWIYLTNGELMQFLTHNNSTPRQFSFPVAVAENLG